MELSNLPLLYLKHLFEYMNTADQINLLKAIDQNVNFRAYLFNQKRLILSDCYNLKANDFKEYAKFFDDPNQIEILNLNFCYNLTWKSVSTLMKKLKFKLLTHLDIISIKIDFNDILKLVNSNKLKEISFSLNESSGADKDKDLNGFSQIETIRIDLNVITQLLFDLLDSFINVNRLEIFSSKPFFRSRLKFYFNKFKNPFSKLKELVVLPSSSILFDYNEVRQIVQRLKKFSISFNLTDNHFENINLNEIKHFGTIINKIEIDNLLENVNFDVNNHLETLQLKESSNIECILNKIPFKIENLIHLNTLDFRDIHIHSTDSICKLLSNLKNLQSLNLPSCALACEEFKAIDTQYMFKRVFEDSDEDDVSLASSKSDEVFKSKQLEYLLNNKIVSFGLYCPKLFDKAKEKSFYHCRNVDSAEIAQLIKFTELKHLHFESFKYIGTSNKFDQFLADLSKTTKLTQLNLIDFNSFVLFDFQTKLTNHLNSFQYLEQLSIKQANFYLTKKLIESIASLSNLKYLKLFSRNFDKNLVKNQTFDSLIRLRKLILFDLKCEFTKNDLQALKKQIKKILPNTIFISILKSDQETKQDILNLEEFFYSQLVTIANTHIQYKPNSIISNFLNEFN